MRMRVTRRTFLQGAAALAAAPAFVPSAALGKDGATAPSERILVGGIGLGGRGTGDLRWMLPEKRVQFLAICDVRKQRREAIKGLVDRHYKNTDCSIYSDLREFLAARTDIDAVLTATGDRWHALVAILAMEAGKDVYCEKPGTLTVAEGQAVVETAARCSRIFQTGTQRLSEPKFIFATELARTGRLGKLHTVRAHLWPRVQDVTANAWLPAQKEPPKDTLDWDLWLGPVPWRPYHPAYLGGCGAWGVYWDFAAGIAGWGSHTIMQCQFGASAEYTSPVEYTNPGNLSGNGLVARYANGVKLVMDFKGWRGSCGVKFEGSEGWASVADGYAKADVSSPALDAETKTVMDTYKAQSQRSFSHMQDFLDCVKSRRQTMANPVAMHRSMSTNHIINISLALGRDLKWDPEKEEFIGDPEANRMRSRAIRQPWQL
ncbi:Gfo/Idh/MocA family oxidoreductase [bacterium]|nr:Gfo/Idh/MocA family oxidoreductase [bacterium]